MKTSRFYLVFDKHTNEFLVKQDSNQLWWNDLSFVKDNLAMVHSSAKFTEEETALKVIEEITSSFIGNGVKESEINFHVVLVESKIVKQHEIKMTSKTTNCFI